MSGWRWLPSRRVWPCCRPDAFPRPRAAEREGFRGRLRQRKRGFVRVLELPALYLATTSIVQRGLAAEASLWSAVRRLHCNDSASAMYAASYADTLCGRPAPYGLMSSR